MMLWTKEPDVTNSDAKEDLKHGYLRDARETLVWKLEGLSEYDIRRPLDPDGDQPARLGQAQHRNSPRILRRSIWAFGQLVTRSVLNGCRSGR